MFRKILVANDGSEGAKKALKAASELAKRYEADLHSITIEEPLHQYEDGIVENDSLQSKPTVSEFSHSLIIDAGLIASAAGTRITSHVMRGHEVETVVTFAKNNGFDLLVMGFMGHSRILGGSWGSTSQNLANLSHCSILVVK